jgi:hypothetical protein
MMELGEQIRARIGAEVLDQMLDDLVEGLVSMARAKAEETARAPVPELDPDCAQGLDKAEQCRGMGKKSRQCTQERQTPPPARAG